MDDERRQIDAFIAAASAFLEVCEGAERLGRAEVLSRLARTLPRLQAAAAELPDVESTLDRPVFTSEERRDERAPAALEQVIFDTDWSDLQTRLHETVDGGETPAASPAFIWDDLADTYKDIKEGFDIIEAGHPEIEAVWEWRFGFWTHWGFHVAEAQRVIHYYVADEGLYGSR